MAEFNPRQSPPKSPVFIKVNPQKLVPSDGAIRAAKLRSNSTTTQGEVPKDDEAKSTNSGAAWNPTTWHSKPIVQDVVYDNEQAVERVLESHIHTAAAGHQRLTNILYRLWKN